MDLNGQSIGWLEPDQTQLISEAQCRAHYSFLFYHILFMKPAGVREASDPVALTFSAQISMLYVAKTRTIQSGDMSMPRGRHAGRSLCGEAFAVGDV